MATNGYVPSYKVHNQKPKKSKTLFMAPVFVRHGAGVEVGAQKKGLQLEPTKDKPCKKCNLPCLIPGLTVIPKESYTQTSKTIIELAQLDQYGEIKFNKMAKLQETPESDLMAEKAERDNTLDMCPDLDLDVDMELDLDMDGSGDRKDYDRFSVDSLNTQHEPEKENPIHSVKATRDLQECIYMNDARDLRLNQWVDNLQRIDTKQKIWGSNMTMPLIAPSVSRVTVSKEVMGSEAYLRRRSKYSLGGGPSRSIMTVSNKCLKCAEKDIEEEVINLPRNVPSSELRHCLPGQPCMTSFHNLIQLNDESTDLKHPTTPEHSMKPAQSSAGTSAIFKRELKSWHCQIQYGPWSSDETETVQKDKSLKSVTGTSKSLIECERVFNESESTNHTYIHVRREAANATKMGFPKCASGTVLTSEPKAGVMTGVTQAQFNYSLYNKKPESCGGSSFMSPTLSSERKSLKQQVESVRWVMGNKFKGRSPTPKMSGRRSDIPFTDLKTRAVKSEELSKSASVHGINKIPAAFSSTTFFGGSNSSCDNGFYILLNRIKSPDFNNALKSLAELIDTARHTTPEVMMPYMTLINQRLLDLLKSPRSHVARTACQLTGHCFEVMKDTRRPEFDDMINTLLYKTADASKFIRQDANMALDAMVTHIPTFHAVRAVCAKGPTHRNPLVRCASVRLIICAVVIAGASAIMNHTAHEATRKRILENITYFLSDKNGETRKYGERLFKILYKEGTFDYYAKKYLNRTKYETLMDILKTLQKRPMEMCIKRDTFKD